MLTEEYMVLVAATTAITAALVVIGCCGYRNKIHVKLMKGRTSSNLAERMAEARTNAQSQALRRQRRGRLPRVDKRDERQQRYLRKDTQTLGMGRLGRHRNSDNVPREDSPLLGTHIAWAHEPQPRDWNDAGLDSDREEPKLACHDSAVSRERGESNGREKSGDPQASNSVALSATDSREMNSASVALTGTSAADEALLSTFIDVLSEGLPLTIHRSSGRSKKVTIWLKDTDTLVWCSRRSLGSKKWHRLGLGGATHVEAGKNAAAFKSGSGNTADEATCLSVNSPMFSLDIEASSELEREALVQGFSMLIEDVSRADTRSCAERKQRCGAWGRRGSPGTSDTTMSHMSRDQNRC